MFMQVNFDVFYMFKMYKAKVEKKIGKTLKFLRANRWGWFTLHEFNIFYDENGVKRGLIEPRTPQQNRIAKRRQIYSGMYKVIVKVKRSGTTILERGSKYCTLHFE